VSTELEALNQQVARMLDSNQLPGARDLYRKITGINPEDAEAWYMLGAINGELGQTEEAIANCRRAIAIDPENIDAMAILGQLLYSLGRSGEAADYLQQVVQQDPADDATWKVLAAIHGQTGEYDECMRCSRRVIELSPQDPAGYTSLGNALFVLGRIDEAVEPCQRSVKLDPANPAAWYLLGQVMEHAGEQKTAENAYMQTIALDNGNTSAWLGLGRLRHLSRDYAGAEQALQQAQELNPENSDAWLALGCIYREQDRPEAEAQIRKALDLRSDLVPAWVQLGNLLQDRGDQEEAAACYDRALGCEPDDADANYNLGVLEQRQGLLDSARSHFDRAIQARPDFAHAHWNKSFICLIQGDYQCGWDEYEWRLQVHESRPPVNDQPPWDGFSLQGMSILVRDEQGYGDTFQFLRYLPLLQARGARVILECHRGLGDVLQGGHGIDELIERSESQQPVQLPYDTHCHLMSLPRLFATRLENIPHDFPYMNADPLREEHWRARLIPDRNYKVGIVWEGGPRHTNNLNRSCRLDDFSPLAGVPNVSLYSLQKGPGVEQADNPPAGMNLIRLDREIDKDARFVDTAAVMKNLDLVISIDTASVHLAGALGVPVWTLLCDKPDWRWGLEGSETPWYPGMRLFRQQRPGQWGEVFERVAQALGDLANTRIR